MKNAVILSEGYSARVKAIELLLRAADGMGASADQLREVAIHLDQASVLYGRAAVGVTYSAFADVVRMAAMLVEWRAAVLGAGVDADRFARAAAERRTAWLKEYESNESLGQLSALVSTLPPASIHEIPDACRRMARIPLPIGVFAADTGGPRLRRRERDEAEGEHKTPVELAVAFLRFAMDGTPAAETHFLTPREAHDLEIEVRVSRWPEAACALELAPLTIEARATYDFPKFTFPRPEGQPPFVLKQRGRAVLNVPQGLNARPFEFKYAAQFHPNAVEQPVAVVGQRTLRIEGIDVDRAPLTGYRGIDRRLLQMRDELRTQPGLYPNDVASTLVIATALAGLAARALQDALFDGVWNEREFQSYVRDDLRRHPHIGPELEEHPASTGGITDLSFRGIRIELKAESTHVTLKECERYADQALSYVVGTGKRVGVLCVLDCSPKSTAPYPAEEGLDVFIRPTRQESVAIVVVLIQGNLARPSTLSR